MHIKIIIEFLSKFIKNAIIICIACAAIIFITYIPSIISIIFNNNPNIKTYYEKNKIIINFYKKTLEIEHIRKTKYYSIIQIPNSVYVESYIGNYYIIDLKKANSSIFLFPKGKYVIKNEIESMQSLDSVKSKILTGILKNYKYKIFIEGEADFSGNFTFKSNFNPKYIYRKVYYHKKRLNNEMGLMIYEKENNFKKYHRTYYK